MPQQLRVFVVIFFVSDFLHRMRRLLCATERLHTAVYVEPRNEYPVSRSPTRQRLGLEHFFWFNALQGKVHHCTPCVGAMDMEMYLLFRNAMHNSRFLFGSPYTK